MINKDYEKALDLLVDKVDGVCDYDWQELCFELGCDMHPDSLRKSFNVGDYSGYQVYKYFTQKYEDETYTDDEQFKELIRLKDELYKEKVKYRDIFREHRKHLSNEARFETLLDAVKECADAGEPIELKHNADFVNSGTDACLLISDIHYGATVDNVLNLYNTDIAKERIQQLLDKTIYYCSIHRVDNLYINLCGDLVSGNIHQSVRVEAEVDIITQTMEIAKILSRFIEEISKYVGSVKVVCVQGNHSRVTSNLKESLNPENFERIVFSYISDRVPNVQMISNGLEDWCMYSIGDKKIFVCHGDKDKFASVKKNAVALTGDVPDEIFMGHLHHCKIEEQEGTEIVLNGSVMGCDSYAMNNRFISKPHQLLRIYHGDDVCTYKLMLD